MVIDLPVASQNALGFRAFKEVRAQAAQPFLPRLLIINTKYIDGFPVVLVEHARAIHDMLGSLCTSRKKRPQKCSIETFSTQSHFHTAFLRARLTGCAQGVPT